jgi:ribosomal protein S18 acetylase RimI-like enzyme
MMPRIKYTVTDVKDLDVIGPLWNKLIVHHRERAVRFRKMLETIDFEKRKKQLLESSKTGRLRIDLARDAGTGELVGYCVSIINAKKQGEIESIYVEERYRRSGIADNLMKKTLKWMDDMSVEKKVLVIAAGNEEVFAFYERYGFYPRGTILEQIKDV